MNFWEKLSLNPAYCGFEGAFLDMLHIKKSYLHIRFCCEGDLYEKYQDVEEVRKHVVLTACGHGIPFPCHFASRIPYARKHSLR